MKFKSVYTFGRINRVIKALKQLYKTLLYKLENTKISECWNPVFLKNKEEYDRKLIILITMRMISILKTLMNQLQIRRYMDSLIHTL